MTEPRHLPNAPIIEALVDFRCKLPKGFDPERFLAVQEDLKSEYPEVKERTRFQAALKVSPDGPTFEPPDTDRGVDAYQFRSEDGRRIAQFQADGFTFNRLAPYTRWEDVRDEANRMWDTYVEVANPEAVTRVALRYINRFSLDLPADLDDYFKATPGTDALRDEIVDFLTKFRLLDPETDVLTNLTLASERTDEGIVDIILDIDSYFHRQFEPNDSEIWDSLEVLRDTKNRIFFSLLTSQTLELFE